MTPPRTAAGTGDERDECGTQSVRELLLDRTRVRARAAGDAAWRAEVVVGVALHNQADALPVCLDSILAQRHSPRTAILILDDASTDGWTEIVAGRLEHPGIVVVRSRCGGAARARNRILDLSDTLFPRARWIARLDPDDRFAHPCSLAAICALGARQDAAWVLGGNRLRREGTVLERTNPARDRLMEPGFVVNLLERMAQGTAENELCSCNLLLARGSGFRYPDVPSAEDHWLVADLLINHRDSGAILPTPFYCDYTLAGSATGASRRAGTYLSSRQALHRAALRWAGMDAGGEFACS
jgi:glycosyltransferase involved in cell wall biosynthesis